MTYSKCIATPGNFANMFYADRAISGTWYRAAQAPENTGGAAVGNGSANGGNANGGLGGNANGGNVKLLFTNRENSYSKQCKHCQKNSMR